MRKEVKSERILRLPPYMFARINEAKLKARQRGVDIIDLGMGNPDCPPAPHIIEKLCQVAHDPRRTDTPLRVASLICAVLFAGGTRGGLE